VLAESAHEVGDIVAEPLVIHKIGIGWRSVNGWHGLLGRSGSTRTYEALQPRISGGIARIGVAAPWAESEIDRGGRLRLSPRCFRPGQ